MISPCSILPLCSDYFCSTIDSKEELILDTINLNKQIIVLTWNNGSPSIRINEKEISSLMEALKIITSIPNLQKQLFENNKKILNKIATIANHLCNQDAELYHFIQNSAVFKQSLKNDYLKGVSITYQAKKGFEQYQVTFSIFDQGKVNYTLI